MTWISRPATDDGGLGFPDGVLVVAHRRHEGAGGGARCKPVCGLRHERADCVCRAAATSQSLEARGGAAVPLNGWTHLAATYDGTTLRLYVNGSLVGSRAVANPLLTSTGVLRFGGNNVWGEFFAGRIDEVRLYNPRGARRCRNPGRHGRDTNRNGHDTSSPFERSTERGTSCGHDPGHVGPDHERERDVQVRHDRGVAYASMPSTFTTTGGTTHTTGRNRPRQRRQLHVLRPL